MILNQREALLEGMYGRLARTMAVGEDRKPCGRDAYRRILVEEITHILSDREYRALNR